MNFITNTRSLLIKEKDFFIQSNLSLFDKIQEWLEFRTKLLKNPVTKEENREIMNKTLKFNSLFENSKFKNIHQFYEDFENLLNDENSADFEIHISEKRYKAHKCVLLARSNYFESIFLNPTIENQDNVLKLDANIIKSGEIFEIMLKYFYLGFYGMKKLALNFDSVNALLQICNYFDVKCPTFK